MFSPLRPSTAPGTNYVIAESVWETVDGLFISFRIVAPLRSHNEENARNNFVTWLTTADWTSLTFPAAWDPYSPIYIYQGVASNIVSGLPVGNADPQAQPVDPSYYTTFDWTGTSTLVTPTVTSTVHFPLANNGNVSTLGDRYIHHLALAASTLGPRHRLLATLQHSHGCIPPPPPPPSRLLR